MRTTILITEGQKRKLILESVNDNIDDNVRNNFDLFRKIVRVSKDEFSNNLGFLITWGVGVGGFVGPVNDLIVGKYPEISERNVILILLAVVGTLFMNKQEFIGDVIKRVKEEGLFEVFKEAYLKAKELKKTFILFLKSLDIAVSNLISMLSYSFLIPSLVPIVNYIESGDVSENDLMLFVTSIGASKLVTLSGKTLTMFLNKLIRKLR